MIRFNRYLYKLNLLSLVFLLSAFPAILLAQNTITGKVVSNNVAIARASVFLNSSATGTETLKDGTFSLNNVKNGNYDVIISCIGYETYQKNINVYNQNINLSTIELQHKIDSLAEVTIVAKKLKPNRDRTEYIRRFTSEFFGDTKNAADCKLLNPDLLDFEYNKSLDRLSATSSDFLILENNALGYRIKYLLKSFLYDPAQHIVYYTGLYTFEEMKGTDDQQRTWQTKRLKTYLGSEMHFLRSCIAGDLDGNNFTVRRMVRTLNPDRQPDSIIYVNLKQMEPFASSATQRYWVGEAAKNKYDDTLFETHLNLSEFLKTTDTKGIYAIGNKDCLVITYGNPNSAFLRNKSVITFKEPYSYFDSNGIIVNPYSNTVEGYWGTRRIAELLPVDYELPAQ